MKTSCYVTFKGKKKVPSLNGLISTAAHLASIHPEPCMDHGTTCCPVGAKPMRYGVDGSRCRQHAHYADGSPDGRSGPQAPAARTHVQWRARLRAHSHVRHACRMCPYIPAPVPEDRSREGGAICRCLAPHLRAPAPEIKQSLQLSRDPHSTLLIYSSLAHSANSPLTTFASK